MNKDSDARKSRASHAATAEAKPAKPQTISDDQPVFLPFLRLKSRVSFQSWVILVLTFVYIVIIPFSQTRYIYQASRPDGKVKNIAGLGMPNMTNRAILSWATTSITEILTMGFGDIEERLPKQRMRFTEKGWESYMKAFDLKKVRQTFRQSQLVLTTVPSNTPVILAQGVNKEKAYQWMVQMPIAMTYATNNNVMRKQDATVTLIIVRIPTETDFSGIAIQDWIFQ